MIRPINSIYLTESNSNNNNNNNNKLSILNELDSINYLKRLNLNSLIKINSKPNLNLLSLLLLQHQIKIPFDSSPIHVKSWLNSFEPITLSNGIGMPLGEESFNRIINQNLGGGYCYVLNGLFASLLRGFGFKVSEIGARVNMKRGLNALDEGVDWSAVTHETLLVDWDESEGNRYLVDVGFGGGGCPIPILLKSGQTSPSISPTESFLLLEESIPGSTPETFQDTLPGFTLYRRVLPPGEIILNYKTAGDIGAKGYWTPCYFFLVHTLSISDIKIANWYNSTCPESTWTNFLAVSTLLPSGARQTLAGPMKNLNSLNPEKELGKYWIKEGIKGIELEVQWVEFNTFEMGNILREKFEFNI